MVVEASQNFQFFRQIPWLLGNNRALSKYRYHIMYNLISITKLQKNHSIKANFKLTTRATLRNGNAKTKFYWDYSSFQMENFKAELNQNLQRNTSFEYSQLQNTFIRVLHKHAPFNNSLFMTKTLRKGMKHRSKF